MNNKCYVAIDLKSFFASVECVKMNLDPMDTNLVVANQEKTDKTICLAITPSLKSYGISSRPRLYEVNLKINEINENRLKKLGLKKFVKTTYSNKEIILNNDYKIDFIIAKPKMKDYIEYSTKIYEIYLEYISKEDIHIYSIDEVFIDITSYLKIYNMTAYDFTKMLLENIYKKTGITATAGIGTNLYLAKVAMDILAKKMTVDNNNMRIAKLTEITYKKLLWNHKPISDFWRVGKAYSKILEKNKMYTMGDVAICSIENENLLYELFGINAELLIDHAWGIEPCTIKDIKMYKSKTHSFSRGQVLPRPYTSDEIILIIKEMIDSITLEMVEKNLVTNKIILDLSHGIDNIKIKSYIGEKTIDIYGRIVPKNTKISLKLSNYTNSEKKIITEVLKICKNRINKSLTINKINISVLNLINSNEIGEKNYKQLDIFNDNYKDIQLELKNEKKEFDIRNAIIKVKNKYGKNAILKANNLENESTAKVRNESIGGHSE